MTEKATSPGIFIIQDVPTDREERTRKILFIRPGATKLHTALDFFYLAQCDKTIEETVWDELVVDWTNDDIAAVGELFPRNSWPETAPYLNLVAYARYVNGY